MTSSRPDLRVERLLRDLAPQVLGAVVQRFRDFAASEDAVQEALIAAATQWPRDGVPEHPRGWLIHVARRRMTDYARSDIARRRREAAVADDLPVAVAPPLRRTSAWMVSRRSIPTTRSSCCSCAVIRRSPPRPRSR